MSPPPPAGNTHMRIGITEVGVDDQDRALAFYTQVLGLQD